MKKLLTICLILLGAVAQAQNFAITATTEAAIRKNIVKGNAANYGFGMINDTLKLVGLTTRNVIFTGSTSKTDIGLGNVDNTSDANKPVSTATQTALNLKQNQLNGTGFVKATGTTISYDNSTYLSTSTAASTYLPINNPTATGTLTAPTIANSLGANFATTSGNVGIGTASPSEKFHIQSTGNVISLIQSTTNSGIALNRIRGLNSTGGILSFEQGININTGNSFETYDRQNAQLVDVYTVGGGRGFYTNGTNRLNIFNNGRVGIGTTTDAGFLLDVNGTARVVGDLSISAGNKLSLSANNLTYNTIERDVTNGGILLTANTYKTFFKDNGNVGIGTTSPNAPLQFANNTVNRKIVLYENTNNDHDFYGFGVNSGILRYQTGIGANHVFYAGATSTTSNELMRIQSNGNVGIGTSTPNASSILDITSTTQGVLFPRLTTTQISAISSPADGLTVYNTTLKVICFYDAGAAVWKRVSHSNM